MLPSHPHILYVMADQLRLQSCGYAGDSKAHTPRIDQLAAAGLRFPNATSMHPVCGPHRASLFTGCYSSTTGYVINELRARSDLPTLAGTLRSNGYRCEYLGKWHLWASEAKDLATFHKKPENQFVPPGPDRLGYDDHWAAYNFNHRYNEGFYYGDEMTRHAIPDYEPDSVTDMAIERLRAAAAREQPLHLCISYGTPHQPWTEQNVPAPWLDMFRDVDFPPPPNCAAGSGEYWHQWYDHDWWDEYVAPNLSHWQRIYYAMTANLDHNLGRLLDTLDELGLADETIVVFSSDHGEMFGAHGRVQKNIFYEEAVRVPFLLRWPGHIPAAGESLACLNTPDIMPTLLGLAGIAAPAGVEGADCSAACRGDAGASVPTAALLQGMGPSVDWDDGFEWRALRTPRYSYARERDGRQYLFDNLTDPLQMADLAAANPPELAHLSAQLDVRMAELGDEFRPITWYRDHWIEDGAVRRGARD